MKTPAERTKKSTQKDQANSIALRPAGLNDVEIVVFTKLLEAVAERRLVPGLRLVEDELAEVFKVSRERIRRILLVLSQHGIVRLEPNKGAYVARPNAIERRDGFEARQLIERHLLERLCALNPARRKMIVSELRKHIEAEHDAIANNQRALQIRLSGEFHLKIANCVGNAELLRMLQDLLVRTSLSLAAHAHHQDLSCSMNEHTVLLDAVEVGDKDRALELLSAHLSHIADDMAENIAMGSDLHRALTE